MTHSLSINQFHPELTEGLEVTNFTVDFLIKNTTTKVFSPETFKGYQRKINRTHCLNIVKYIIKNDYFFFPTPIICANKDSKLFIVDGQHRVEALRIVKEEFPAKYEQIKEYEISSIVLNNPTDALEVDTFITINKTSKKVDTSLALVLKTMHSGAANAAPLAKKQYILVELARSLDKTDKHWNNEISWEGTPQATGKVISLNSFVRATMPLINLLEKNNLIAIDSLNETHEQILKVYTAYWEIIMNKWPQVFHTKESSKILKGSIGLSSTLKFLSNKSKDTRLGSIEEFINHINNEFELVTINPEYWLPGNIFSSYSSGSGFSNIAKILEDSQKK